jgi:hypothetical protein
MIGRWSETYKVYRMEINVKKTKVTTMNETEGKKVMQRFMLDQVLLEQVLRLNV